MPRTKDQALSEATNNHTRLGKHFLRIKGNVKFKLIDIKILLAPKSTTDWIIYGILEYPLIVNELIIVKEPSMDSLDNILNKKLYTPLD
jgi:hypothetical protein